MGKFTVLLIFLLSAAAQGRVRRQGTLEESPVLPFAAQSKPGDESQSLEVQNQNAEKGIIDNKDAQVEEILEYVDDSEPGADPEAVVDQLEVDEEPDMDSIVQDDTIGGPVARVYKDGAMFERPYYGYQAANQSSSTESPKSDKPWYKNSTIWIVVGVILGAILIAIILFCCCCKKNKN